MIIKGLLGLAALLLTLAEATWPENDSYLGATSPSVTWTVEELATEQPNIGGTSSGGIHGPSYMAVIAGGLLASTLLYTRHVLRARTAVTSPAS